MSLLGPGITTLDLSISIHLCQASASILSSWKHMIQLIMEPLVDPTNP